MKKQRIYILVFSLILFALTFFIAITIENRNCMDKVKITFKAADTSMSLSLFQCENKYYAFLPSHVRPETINISSNTNFKVELNDKTATKVATKNLTFNEEYDIKVFNALGFEISSETIIFLKSENIPSLSITLSDGTLSEINDSKDVSKKGYIQTTLANNTVDFLGEFSKIKGRGNSSWGEEKKSYTIEFDTETSLLGMESGLKWLLISNSFDESCLRNKLVYDTAKEYGVNFALDSEYVDLYINNEYLGLYLLCEKIEIAPNRVNIPDLQETTQQLNQAQLSSYPQFEKTYNGVKTKGFTIPNNPKDITGGYLLQIDTHSNTFEIEESCVFTATTPYIVSAPKNASEKQIDYISSYISDVESRLQIGDLSKIDTDSFITQILIMECFANTDGCSIYLFKNPDHISDELVCGPIWDYDLSMGNRWNYSNSYPYTLYSSKVNLFSILLNDQKFYSELKKVYSQTFSNQLYSYANSKLSEYKDLIENSFYMNKIRWKHTESIESEANRSQKRFDSLDDHIKRIDEFLSHKKTFLDDIWLNDIVYYTISFKDSENFEKKYPVKAGETFNNTAPAYITTTATQTFDGWFDENGNEYKSGQEITQSKTYTARFVEKNIEIDSLSNIATKKDNTILIFSKNIFNKLCGIEFELWCFAFIGFFVAVFVIKDLFLTKIIRRIKNGKRY